MIFPTLDVVVPLDTQDYRRFEILRTSLDHFFPDLGTCWVPVSDDDSDQIRKKVENGRYRVIAESTLIPELGFYDRLRVLFGRSHRPLRGWLTQQLRKLAIAEKIDSPFYLTLDADVICTRLVRYSDLIRNDRALGVKGSSDLHREWYDRAAQVLAVPKLRRWHNLAPALLSKDAVIMLQKHLAGRVHPVLRGASRMFGPQTLLHNILASWRSYLLRNLPWTEYALYYTFLEGTSLYDRYHFLDTNYRLERNSVWKREDFASWDVHQSFGAGARPNFFFTVIQSSSETEPELVWEKVRPYLKGATRPAVTAMSTMEDAVER